MSGASLAFENGRSHERVAPSRNSLSRRLFGRLASVIMPLLVPLAAVGIWSISSRIGWLPRQILPPPGDVWSSTVDMARSDDLARDVFISLSRVLEGFAIGGVLGFALGAAMGLSPRVEDYARPLFTAIAQVPTIGWVPLLMIPLGIGEPLKLVIIAKASLVPIAVNTLNGIRAVPSAWFEVASTFRYTHSQLLRHVVLPAALPSVCTGIRYGLTNAWKALVAAELLASTEGLGYELVWGRQMMQMDVVIATMLVIAVIGLLFDAGLAMVEGRSQRWKASRA